MKGKEWKLLWFCCPARSGESAAIPHLAETDTPQLMDAVRESTPYNEKEYENGMILKSIVTQSKGVLQ